MGTGGQEPGRKGAGDRRREGGKQDSHGGWIWEKLGRILQHFAIEMAHSVH